MSDEEWQDEYYKMYFIAAFAENIDNEDIKPGKPYLLKCKGGDLYHDINSTRVWLHNNGSGEVVGIKDEVICIDSVQTQCEIDVLAMLYPGSGLENLTIEKI